MFGSPVSVRSAWVDGDYLTVRLSNSSWRSYHSVQLVLEKRNVFGTLLRPEKFLPGEYSAWIVEPFKTEDFHEIFYDKPSGWRVAGIYICETDKIYKLNVRVTNSWGLYVATAAYGDVNHPKVQELKHLRDEVLLPTKTGVKLVDWYNRNGPGMAEIVERHTSLQLATRALLTPIVNGLKASRKLGLIRDYTKSKNPEGTEGPP